MKYKVVIPGKFATLNEFIGANRRGKGKWQSGNDMKQNDQSVLMYHIRKQLKNAKIVPPVYVKYRYFEPNRKRDKDNIEAYFRKIFQEALVQAGYLKNDNWSYITGFSDDFEIDVKRPRIEVEIYDGTE